MEKRQNRHFWHAVRPIIALGFSPMVVLMLKGIFWLVVLLVLMGFHRPFLAL